MNKSLKELKEKASDVLPWYMWLAYAIVVVVVVVAAINWPSDEPVKDRPSVTALVNAGCTQDVVKKLTDEQAYDVVVTMRNLRITRVGKHNASAPLHERLVVNTWGDDKPFVIGAVAWIDPTTCSVKADYSKHPPTPKYAKVIPAEWRKDFFVYQSEVNAAIHDNHDMKARGIPPFPCTVYHQPLFTPEVINKKVAVGPTNSDLEARQYYNLSITLNCVERLPEVDRSVQRA